MGIWIRQQPDRGARPPRRGLGRWALGSIAAAVLVVAAITASRTSVFHARRVEVIGASALSRAQVLELAAVDRHTNAVWLDEGAVERRLESAPWVAEADVRVSLGLAIEISVTERVPVAVASGEGGSVLVASDGTTLGAVPRSASVRSLPQIELPAVPPIDGAIAPTAAGAALALGAMDGDLRDAVDRVAVLPGGTLEVWMRDGPRVSFGSATALGPKARAIASALAWAREAGEQLVSLSVVAPWAPAGTLAP